MFNKCTFIFYKCTTKLKVRDCYLEYPEQFLLKQRYIVCIQVHIENIKYFVHVVINTNLFKIMNFSLFSHLL